MQLGTFTIDSATGGYIGSIRLLTGSVERVRIVPRAKTLDAPKDAPDFDVLAGAHDSDFGNGWLRKRASDGIEWISLKLYDPSFNNGQVLRPALWPRRDGSFALIHEPLDPQMANGKTPSPSAQAAPAPTPPPAPARPNDTQIAQSKGLPKGDKPTPEKSA